MKVFVDNMGASRILMVGSPKPHLQEIAVDIFIIILFKFRLFLGVAVVASRRERPCRFAPQGY